MEEAYEAAAKGRFALAEKLSRRAVDEGFVNPRIWRDRGRIARLCGDADEAEQAFRHAIAIAPSYAEAFAELGRLQAERGKLAAAERLLRRAVELRTADLELAAEHARVLEAAGGAAAVAAPAAGTAPGEPVRLRPSARASRVDWEAAGAELAARGVVTVPRLADLDECAALVAFADGPAVEARLDRDDAGAKATWHHLRVAASDPVTALQQDLAAPLAQLADERQARLGRTPCFAPGGRPAVVVGAASTVRLGPDGFVLPAAGAAAVGADAFPFRLLLCIGPGAVRHELRDLRPGRKVHARHTVLRCGDGLIACDRTRIVTIAGADGLQEVAHGLAAATADARVVLEIGCRREAERAPDGGVEPA